MSRYALIKDNKLLNIVAAEQGWKSPEGELVPVELLTREYAESRGARFSKSDRDLLEACESGDHLAAISHSEIAHYYLGNIEKTPGLYLMTSGTVSLPKIVHIPWPGVNARADSWLELLDEDLVGPVWFYAPYHVAVSTRFACMRQGVPIFGMREDPPAAPQFIVTGDLKLLRNIRYRLSRKSKIICMGSAQYDAIRQLTEAGYIVLDQYGAIEAGIMAITHNQGQLSTTRMIENLRIGQRGTVEVSSPMLASGYVDRPILTENGWWDTGDIAEISLAGNLAIKGRT